MNNLEDQFPALYSAQLELLTGQERAALEDSVAAVIDVWIRSDHNKLILALYQLDIDEHRLKKMLKEKPDTESAKLIASMIVDRQLQKLQSRSQSKPSHDIPDDEKW